MTVTPKLDLIVLDCPDALALASFYGAVLGWTLEDGADRDWADLAPPEGGITPDNPDGRPALAFQRIDDFVTPTWPGGAHPQQLHLDLCTPDLAATEDLVLTAGARKHEHQPNHDRFRVFVDPAGHPFCLIPG
jgi:catechol 2,3-dioxygenase-like lactoylglutathione lyase family enzyme